mgnify:CR=1 FL=1
MKYYATQICEKGSIAVDDTILVKDVVTTAGSKILDGFKPLFSAEAVTECVAKGVPPYERHLKPTPVGVVTMSR